MAERWEAVKWAALMLWIGGVSTAAVIVADVPLWFASLILAAWLFVSVRLWPSARSGSESGSDAPESGNVEHE